MSRSLLSKGIGLEFVTASLEAVQIRTDHPREKTRESKLHKTIHCLYLPPSLYPSAPALIPNPSKLNPTPSFPCTNAVELPPFPPPSLPSNESLVGVPPLPKFSSFSTPYGPLK